MKIIERIIIVAGIIGILFLMKTCVAWKWNECRKVGHGAVYCAHDLSR